MTFGLPSWLKSTYPLLSYEMPVWYPSRDQPDHREWLVANGLGGYASSTVCGCHTRRYHGVLVPALNPPVGRHIVLSKVDEVVTVDGLVYELATNDWASGVVSPTGYKLLESFTTLPVPTWVYNLGGHYLIKQLTMPWETNRIHLGYFWLPDEESAPEQAEISLRFLTAFRPFDSEVRGAAGKNYSQSLSQTGVDISLDGSDSKLLLSFNRGQYQVEQQWWWGYHWVEEANRGLPDQEDLFLLGDLVAPLDKGQELSVVASLNESVAQADCKPAVEETIKRQRHLLAVADLPRNQDMNQLVLSCDQFLVERRLNGRPGSTIVAGYPWFTDFGRDVMISLPGLVLSTRRYEDARSILRTWSGLLADGLMPSRFPEDGQPPEYQAADTTLWWAYALNKYLEATRDNSFIKEQLPLLLGVTRCYLQGTRHGIKIDPQDGLLTCGSPAAEMTWMDTRVSTIPITPRSGKPVELSALWYNLLRTLISFCKLSGEPTEDLGALAELTEKSMQKFWNNEGQCLYDVLEPGQNPRSRPDDSLRPNQLFAISLPFRCFTPVQEKAVLQVVEDELLTPLGLRSLAPSSPGYQGRYGCGLSRPDAYHRDLSYHQGTVWPWLMGAYCDALLNLSPNRPEEAYARMRVLVQPLRLHLSNSGCLGAVSEIFDGNTPHQPGGSPSKVWSVAELMRITATLSRQES